MLLLLLLDLQSYSNAHVIQYSSESEMWQHFTELEFKEPGRKKYGCCQSEG